MIHEKRESQPIAYLANLASAADEACIGHGSFEVVAGAADWEADIPGRRQGKTTEFARFGCGVLD